MQNQCCSITILLNFEHNRIKYVLDNISCNPNFFVLLNFFFLLMYLRIFRRKFFTIHQHYQKEKLFSADKIFASFGIRNIDVSLYDRQVLKDAVCMKCHFEVLFQINSVNKIDFEREFRDRLLVLTINKPHLPPI
jgi:hypothetical protein